LQNEIIIDYVRIPKKHEELSKSMLLYFLEGNSISRILEDTEFTAWDRKGLSFYENISLKHAILTNKVIEEILTMQDGEIKVIKTGSAYYVVRFLQSKETRISDMADSSPVLLNLLRAQSLENGNTLFDPYRFEKSIKCDERLLSRIDFSIAPFHTDSDFIAKIDGRFVGENDVKEKISELPVKIQSLFVNSSTRVRAIASLVLLNGLRKEKPEKVGEWLQPYKIDGYNQLMLDLRKIEKMEIIQKDTVDNQILAYSGNWNMTVKDFKKELNELSPITRLDIANNSLLREMIEYLANRYYGFDSKLIINSGLFESIDIMGKSYDQLNDTFDENTIVGTLGNIDISVGELRELVIQLSEVEKDRFLELSTRKESFNVLMAEKFWRNLYDRKIVENNPDFKKEISNYQNRLLVELLHENELQMTVPQIDGEQLNLKMLQAAKSINEDKLRSYIRTLMQNYTVRINSRFFQKKFNFDTGISEYRMKAVHIPDSLLVKMKMDGDTSDWNWVPEKYGITEQSMIKNTSTNNDLWKCRIIVGWSDLDCKLYIMAKVTDDIFMTDNSMYYTNDCMHFAINADNGGGRYGEEQGRTKYSILCALAPSSDKSSKLLINVGPDWMQEKQHINWSAKHYKNKEGEYEMVYEMCLSLWDKWENEGPKYSSPAEVYSFKKIRLALVFNDSDAPDDTFTEYTNFTGIDWWKNADEIPGFILDMPSKNGVSWQGIHYVLSQ
jgi:hypothetical protein